jgi:uncharacterized protein YjbJ (UPF0337 family)
MIRAETIRGNWNKVRGQLQRRWGQLTGDEFDQFEGDVDALVGEIQRKTGEARETIEDYLEYLSSEGASAVGRAGETAKQYASQAASAMAAAPGRIARGARATYENNQEIVRERPMESLATAFVAGFVAGVAIGLLMRSR